MGANALENPDGEAKSLGVVFVQMIHIHDNRGTRAESGSLKMEVS
jgi:hypothetical protein